MRKGTYSSKKPLNACEFKNLKRKVGVSVSEKFMHNGMNPPMECVEVSYEVPTVNTAEFAKLGVPAGEWQNEAQRQTDIVIKKLRTLIKELSAHQARLVKEKFRIK